ncbi:hypothetical protein A3D70_01040 [Candidatus Adlerbacteria bacterium RIFCSPHIGHO2_02_FULL_54_18]|uniref:Uncharacterized protein n=2 Tax=Candidatus Adleribacteriota TaxID=1752736 RepID=A0A1F4Y348_9BACT|nr:MAG: hypothetical protein A2949_01680 [Candidatus Adlerbacteria bacterium RIFCSPLOWO2_01_FULL_54_21b]OGC88278.1 MAG: hypothetical protein A3D70_01040 [Candidatus Adlerbacteria bacterium RIFCSPHIGHO2_02_FULL_54_18]
MALFFSVMLFISILGLSGLIVAKRWETVNGRAVLFGARPAVGRMLGTVLHIVEHRIPAFLRAGAVRLFMAARTGMHIGVAWTVFHAERLLERTLRALRHTTAARGEGEASAFLREVAEHKKSLLKSSDKKKNAIYEE